MLLSVTLMGAAGWMMPGVPQSYGRGQCVRHQPDAAVLRLAVAPQMNNDGLSAEFQRLVSQRSGTVFGQPTEVLREQKVDTPWVLIFNAGTHDEGMYTLQGRKTSAKCSGTFVLAFARQEEASRFSMLLQAQGFGMPTASAWEADELSEFCASADFGIGFVPQEALLFPPQNNYFDADTAEAPQHDAAPTTLASDRGGWATSPNHVMGEHEVGPDMRQPQSRPESSRPSSRPSPRSPSSRPDERDGTRSSTWSRPPSQSSRPSPSSRPPVHKDPDFMNTPPRASPPSRPRDGDSISSRPTLRDAPPSSRPVPRTVYGEAEEVLREQSVQESWVLIFNKGREDEGMYTLQGRETPEKGSGTFVMAFARQEEASRFSMLLQAQGFGMPTASAWSSEELSDFCMTADFGLGFVPHGALVFPPEDNYFDADAFAKHKSQEESEDAWGTEGAEVRRGLDRLFEL